MRLVRGCLCITIIALVAPGAASAGVFNVSNTADAVALNPATGCATANTPPTNGACTLRSAVQAADAATGSSTINLAPGTYKLTLGPPAAETPDPPGDDASKGDLEITNTTGKITVAGAGSSSTIIDANSIDRAFDTRPNTNFALSGVTVRNGRAGGFTAGTSCPTPSLSLPSVSGGAIDASGTLTATGDVFTNNMTLGSGGAIATESDTAPFVMVSTTVDHNSACPRTANGGPTGGGVGVLGSGPATIDSSTISHNFTGGTRAFAGGLSEEGDAAVTITRSSIAGNSTDGGGGGFALEGGGKLHLVSDTVSGNIAGGAGLSNGAPNGGGGVLNDGSDTDTYVNTTITGNHAPVGGGILANSGASDTLSFSTVNGNSADTGTGNLKSVTFTSPSGSFPSRFMLDDTIVAAGTGTPSNCGGPSFTSNGHNLFDDSGAACGAVASDQKNKNPKLGPLTNNGGPTPTEALQSGSPAIDAADDSLCANKTGGVDQRGVKRPQGPHCDVGAYEATPQPPQSTCTKPAGKLAGKRLGFFKLGMKLRRAERIVPRFRRIRFGFIDFCLTPKVGLGIRVQVPSKRLLARIPKSKRKAIKGRIVIALTNNSFYKLRGIAPGTRLKRARKKLHLGRAFFIGNNTWYIVPGPKANGILKVRKGVILEVGIANKQLSSGSYKTKFRFLTSWKNVR